MLWIAALLLGPLLWLAGAIFFDAVHWALHALLRSGWAPLRALARPHAVHHEWIDRSLVTHFDRRRANVFAHIVPEYGTQLAFTGVLALWLPLPFVAVLGGLQTLVFLGILRLGGQDVNHRPAARIDAHPAGPWTPPSYHALHHAWPDAYFSSYTKLWDAIVGGGAAIGERRFAWLGAPHPVGRALRAEVERRGGRSVDDPDQADVVVLQDPRAPLAAATEPVLAAARARQLPPEVWALRADADDPLARHYRDDVRVCFRTLWVGKGAVGAARAARGARRALRWIRRDARFVSLCGRGGGRRFRATRPRAPEGVTPVRHRLELA